MVDVVAELGLARELRLDLDVRAQHRAQLVHRDHVKNFSSCDRQHVLGRIIGDRQYAVPPRELLGNQLERLRVGDDVAQVDRLLPDRARHDVADRTLGDESEAHQQTADWNVVVALLGQRDGELIGRDQALLDQQFAETEFLALFSHGG